VVGATRVGGPGLGLEQGQPWGGALHGVRLKGAAGDGAAAIAVPVFPCDGGNCGLAAGGGDARRGGHVDLKPMLKAGIVGTCPTWGNPLFNALVANAQAQACNFPPLH